MRFGVFCLLLSLFIQVAFAQTKIQGYLVDSISTTVLRSASVSIFQQGKKK